MEVSAIDNVLTLNLSSDEYQTICEENDGMYVDVFMSTQNVNVLFPGWMTYINEDDIIATLDWESLHRFNELHLQIPDSSDDIIREILNVEAFPLTDEDNNIPALTPQEVDDCAMITFYFESII